jgi:Serine/Threonine/Tyrosine Kinase found in polyvalent proteins
MADYTVPVAPEVIDSFADDPGLEPGTNTSRAANIGGAAAGGFARSILTPLAAVGRLQAMSGDPRFANAARVLSDAGAATEGNAGIFPTNPAMAKDFSTGLARAAGAAPVTALTAEFGLPALVGTGALSGYEGYQRQKEDYDRRAAAGLLEPGEEAPSPWKEIGKGAASNAAFLVGGSLAGRAAGPILSNLAPGTAARVLTGYGATVGGNLAGSAAARKIETGSFGYPDWAAAGEDIGTGAGTFGFRPTQHLLESKGARYISPEVRARLARRNQAGADAAARAAQAQEEAATTSMTSQTPNLTLSPMSTNTSQVESMVTHIIPGSMEGKTEVQEWPYVGTSTPGERHIVNLTGQNLASQMLGEGDIAAASLNTASRMEQEQAAKLHALWRIRQTLDTLRNPGEEGNQIAEGAGLSRTHAIAAFAEAERILMAGEPVQPDMSVQQMLATRQGASVLGNLNTIVKQAPTDITAAGIREELNKPEVQAELAKSGLPVPPTDFERLQPAYVQQLTALLHARDKEIEDAHWQAQSALAAKFMAEKLAGPPPSPEQQQQIWEARNEAMRADAAEKLRAKLAQEQADAAAAAEKERQDLAAAHEESVPATAAPALVDKLTGKPVARISRLADVTQPPTTPTNETGQNIQQVPNPLGQTHGPNGPLSPPDNAPTGIRGVSVNGPEAAGEPVPEPGSVPPVGQADDTAAGLRGQGQLGQGSAQRPVLTEQEQGWVKNLQEVIAKLDAKKKLSAKEKVARSSAQMRLDQILEEARTRQPGDVVPPQTPLGVPPIETRRAEAPPTPESKQTLLEQQKQLVDPKNPRRAMLFTPGETPLDVPEGMVSVIGPSGTWHFNPKKLSARDVVRFDQEGRAGELLNLGKETKAEATAAPGKTHVVSEHTPEGVEVRSALTSEAELEAKQAEFEKNKTPGNVISVKTPEEIIAARKGEGELDTTSEVTGDEYVGGLVRPGQRGVALGTVGDKVRIKWEDGKVTDEEFYKVMSQNRPESAGDIMRNKVEPAIKKGQPIPSEWVDAVQPPRVKGVGEPVPQAWIRRQLEIEGYREKDGQWVKVAEREGPPASDGDAADRAKYHNRVVKMSDAELAKELANPPTDRWKWETLQIAKLYSDLRAHNREAEEMAKGKPAAEAKPMPAEMKEADAPPPGPGEPDLVVVGCGKGKCTLAKGETTEAGKLYTGPLFSARRDFAQGQSRPWAIVSALHGMLAPGKKIGTYDQKYSDLSPEQKKEWKFQVRRWVIDYFGGRHNVIGKTLEVHAGADYVKAMDDAVAELGVKVTAPMKGKAVGKQLASYKAGVERLAPAPEAAPAAGALAKAKPRDLRADFESSKDKPEGQTYAEWLQNSLVENQRIKAEADAANSRWVSETAGANIEQIQAELAKEARFAPRTTPAPAPEQKPTMTPIRTPELDEMRKGMKLGKTAGSLDIEHPRTGHRYSLTDNSGQEHNGVALGEIDGRILMRWDDGSTAKVHSWRLHQEGANAKREKLIDVKLQKGNVTPLVEFEVRQNPDGTWSSHFQLHTNIQGYGVPWSKPVATRGAAIHDGLNDAMGWLERVEPRTDLKPKEKPQLQKMREQLEELQAKTPTEEAKPVETPAPAAAPAETPAAATGPVFTRDEIEVSKPQVTIRKATKGGESVTTVSAPGKVTSQENWSRLGDLDKIDAHVEAQVTYPGGIPTHPKKANTVWQAFGGKRSDRNRTELGRDLTYAEAVERAKDFVEGANPKGEAKPAEAPAAAPTAPATGHIPFGERMDQIQIRANEEALATGRWAGGKKVSPGDRAGIQREIDRLKKQLKEKQAVRAANPDTPVEAIGEIKEGVADKPKEFTNQVKKVLTATLENQLKTAPFGKDVGYKAGTIAVHIPGDGDFRILHTQEAIGEVLKGIRTMPGAESQEPRGPRPVGKVELTGEEKPRLMTPEELAAEKAAPTTPAEEPAPVQTPAPAAPAAAEAPPAEAPSWLKAKEKKAWASALQAIATIKDAAPKEAERGSNLRRKAIERADIALRRAAEILGVKPERSRSTYYSPESDLQTALQLEKALGEIAGPKKPLEATNIAPTREEHQAQTGDLDTRIGQLDAQIAADQKAAETARFSPEKLAALDRLMKNRALREDLNNERANMKPEPPPTPTLSPEQERAAQAQMDDQAKLGEAVAEREALEKEVKDYGDPQKLKGVQRQTYRDAVSDLNAAKKKEAFLRKKVEGGGQREVSAPSGLLSFILRPPGMTVATLQRAHNYVHEELVPKLQEAASKVFGSGVEVKMKGTQSGQPAVIIHTDGSVSIHVPEEWAGLSRSAISSDAKFGAFVKKAFTEELQHVAALKVLHDMWSKLPEAGRKAFGDYADEKFQGIARDIQEYVNKLRDQGKHGEAQAIEDAIRASREAYDQQRGSMSGAQLIEDMVKNPESALRYGMELTRQLNQLRNKQQLSESFIQRVLRPLNDFYKQVVTHLKGLLGKAESGEISQSLKEILDGMQSALEGKPAEVEGGYGPDPRSQATINRIEETRIPWYGNDREDIDARTALRSHSPDSPRAAAADVIARNAEANGRLPLGSEARNNAELEQLARAQPERLIDRDQLVGDGSNTRSAGEHTIVFDPDSQRVFKLVHEGNSGGVPRLDEKLPPNPIVGSNIVSYAASPHEYLDRVRLNNENFGDDQRYHGVWLTPEGEPGGIVISQPFVKGTPPTPEQVSDYMRGRGFHEVDLGTWFRPSDNVLVTDAHNGNFFVKNGELVPVDMQTKVATPAERAEAMRAMKTMMPPSEGREISAPKLVEKVIEGGKAAAEYVKKSKAREYGYALSKSARQFTDSISTVINNIESISNTNGVRLANSMYNYYANVTGKKFDKAIFGLGKPSKALVEASEMAFPWREAGFGTVTDVNSPAEYDAKVAAARAKLDNWVDRINQALQSGVADVVTAAERLKPIYEKARDHIQTDAGLKEAIQQTARIEQETSRQIQDAKQRGIDINEVEDYIRRLYEDPAGEKAMRFVPSSSGRGGAVANDKGFAKSRAYDSAVEAMEHGLKIATMDTAKLLGHGEASLQKMMGEKAMYNQLRATPAPFTGRPVIVDKPRYVKAATGKLEPRAPAGYQQVDVGGKPTYIEENVAPLFQMLNEGSDVRRGITGRTLLAFSNNFKAFTLLIDTYHSMRLAATLGGVLAQGKGIPKIVIGGELARMKRFIKRGQAALDYEPGELLDMVKHGQITAEDAQWAKDAERYYKIGSRSGVAWGRQVDNLYEQIGRPFLVKILHGWFGESGKGPGEGLETFNEFVFKKQARAAMMVGFRTILDRNIERFGNSKSQREIELLSGKETNEIFGNLGKQSWIKSKTGQDAARLFMLAPNWNEGRLRFQGRGLAQAAQWLAKPVRREMTSYVDANGQVQTTSKWKLQQPGNAVGTMLALAAGSFAVNQAVNGFFRGQPTWDNEDGHKMDAWIPGGKNGFFYSPLNLGAEDIHTLMKYGSKSSPLESLTRIAMNKASGLVRGTAALAGIDPLGRQLPGDANRLTQAARGYAPIPIAAGAIPGLTGLINPDLAQKGDFQRQLLGMAGIKVDRAESAEQRVRQGANKFLPQQFPRSTSQGDFSRLRNLVSNEKVDNAADEIIRLVSKGKSEADILHSFAPTRTFGQTKAADVMLRRVPALSADIPRALADRSVDYNTVRQAIAAAKSSPKWNDAILAGRAAKQPVQ